MKVTENRISICGWPTDVVAIDHCVGNSGLSKPHTLLFFVPGNPGVIHWYVDFLFKILQNLGDGFAVRGVSYAGHGVGHGVVGTNEDHSTIITGPNDENMKSSQQREDQSKRKNMNIAWTMDGQGKKIVINKTYPKNSIIPTTSVIPDHLPQLNIKLNGLTKFCLSGKIIM